MAGSAILRLRLVSHCDTIAGVARRVKTFRPFEERNEPQTAKDARERLREARGTNIDWQDIESLFIALGAEVNEAAGSRVWVTLNGVRAVFHRPHPEKEAGKLMVHSVRDFFENAGVRP